MRSGVMRIRVRFLRRWRMTSWPAANGMRWVNPSIATVSPSRRTSSTASARERKRDIEALLCVSHNRSEPVPGACVGDLLCLDQASVGPLLLLLGRQLGLRQLGEEALVRFDGLRFPLTEFCTQRWRLIQ